MRSARSTRSKKGTSKVKTKAPHAAHGGKLPQPASRIRILVADDLSMDRAGMMAMLGSQPDFEIVGEASSTLEAAKICRDSRPAVVVVALRLRPTHGRTSISTIRASVPDVPILAVAERGEGQCLVLNPPGSRHTDTAEGPPVACSTGTDCLQLAVAEGATGTIRRSASPDEFFRAIRTLASGNAWYEAGTATAIMRHALAGNKRAASAPLSKRELEVAELISAGRSNKEIAQSLDIIEATVKKHVGHILEKLNLQDRLQVGLYVARNPLLLQPLETMRR